MTGYSTAMSVIEILKRCMTEARIGRIEGALARRTRDICVVIDRLDKPHNYMAVMRTCDAFGIQDLHIVPLESDSAQAVSSKVTQGAHKWLTLHRHDDWSSCVRHLHGQDYRLYASCLHDEARGLGQLELSGKIALVFGNELKGLRPDQIADCDGCFMLPMRGLSQSFNVSVACALSLQALLMLREQREIPLSPLPESERAALREEWYVKACPNAESLIAEAVRRGELP